MNYYYPPQNVAPNNTMRFISQTLKGRPVSSLEEVKASIIDFDGSISFFPDLAHGKIYTKQCNMDGTSSLNVYEFKELTPEGENRQQDYVTRVEFNATLQELKQALQQAFSISAPAVPNADSAPTPPLSSGQQTSIQNFDFFKEGVSQR